MNIIFAEEEKRFKLIDLGACADLRSGTNYIPDESILDPTYCPPEQACPPPFLPCTGNKAKHHSTKAFSTKRRPRASMTRTQAMQTALQDVLVSRYNSLMLCCAVLSRVTGAVAVLIGAGYERLNKQALRFQGRPFWLPVKNVRVGVRCVHSGSNRSCSTKQGYAMLCHLRLTSVTCMLGLSVLFSRSPPEYTNHQRSQ